MKPSNPEVVEIVEKRQPVSRVGQLRREKMIASKQDESKAEDKNQSVSLNPVEKK